MKLSGNFHIQTRNCHSLGFLPVLKNPVIWKVKSMCSFLHVQRFFSSLAIFQFSWENKNPTQEGQKFPVFFLFPETTQMQNLSTKLCDRLSRKKKVLCTFLYKDVAETVDTIILLKPHPPNMSLKDKEILFCILRA